MAVADSTGVRSRADHRRPTASISSDDREIWFPQAAGWDDDRRAIPSIPGPRRPVDHVGDSDPNANEALRRARALPHRTPGAIKRAVEVEAAYAERERLLRATVTAERIMAGAL